MAFWDKVLHLQDKTRPFCTAIVPAAGSSQRMGGGNKLFMELCGVPVLVRTLQAIDRAELVDEIIVAAREDLLQEVAELCKQAGLHKRVRVVCGGDSRTASVQAAALEADPKAKLLAVHDGARPLVDPAIFDGVIRAACRTYAAAPALAVTDTIKVVSDEGYVTETPDRSHLYAVQTPQVFRAEVLRAALQAVLEQGGSVTDDCAAVEQLGKKVYLVPGQPDNIKITTPLDLTVAEAILRQREETV